MSLKQYKLRVLLPILPDFINNQNWVNLATYIHGGIDELAWLVVNCLDDENAFYAMVQQHCVDMVDHISCQDGDLGAYELDKFLQASSNPAYKIMLAMFYEAHVPYYEQLLGRMSNRAPTQKLISTSFNLHIEYEQTVRWS